MISFQVEGAQRVSRLAAALFCLVLCILLAPLGAWLVDANADGQPPGAGIPLDPISDSVGATAAEFRVDEAGAATYSVPIYTVPGTAGVAPKLALNYSSQGGYGPLGKGWTISGLSSISRCRSTREAGDFIVNNVATDG